MTGGDFVFTVNYRIDRGFEMLRIFWATFVTIALGFVGIAEAAKVDDAIVYIECYDAANNRISAGSGVVVSEDGHVLTARHVFFPKGHDVQTPICRASIGTADPNPQIRLIVPAGPDNGIDAWVGRLGKKVDVAPMRFCEFGDDAARMQIFVSGFPGGTKTGRPSFRSGIVSTTYVDPKGIVETDGLTAQGMSGGPVVTADANRLVAIVAGAEFDNLGVTHWGVLPVSEFANIFDDLESTGKSCAFEAVQGDPIEERMERLEAELAAAKNPFLDVAQFAQTKIVSVVCALASGRTSVGTGILIGKKGHVLTAKHVVDETTSCGMSLGRAANPDRLKNVQLFLRAKSEGIDAAILQLAPPDWDQIKLRVGDDPVSFSSPARSELGAEIATVGFNARGFGGIPSMRRGFLNTQFPSELGLIEASVDTVQGMGGAPVFTKEGKVIGIVGGVEVSPTTGMFSHTAIISSERLTQEFSAFISLTE